jgi:hypothetical protein
MRRISLRIPASIRCRSASWLSIDCFCAAFDATIWACALRAFVNFTRSIFTCCRYVITWRSVVASCSETRFAVSIRSRSSLRVEAPRSTPSAELSSPDV